MKISLKNILFQFVIVLAATTFLSACNTVQGVGKDVQKLGGSDENTTTVKKVETIEVVPAPSSY
jgi:predicted small secreted protein